MSNKKDNTVKKKKLDKRQLFVRVMCGFLAALMVLSCAVLIVQLLSVGSYAVPDNYVGGYYMTSDGSQPLISVGLMYDDGVTVSYETFADLGFELGYVGEDRLFNKITETSLTDIAVVKDGNLSKSDRAYSDYNGGTISLGGYHAIVYTDEENYDLQYETLSGLFPSLDCFYGYTAKGYFIGVGCFTKPENVSDTLNALTGFGYEASVSSVSSTATVVVNPEDDDVVFYLDGGSDFSLAQKAISTEEKSCFIQTTVKNTYDGIFKYTRYGNGVAVTNILPLEDYVAGTLPYEVSNQWADELLKTFAVAIRSFALASRKHSTFDLCNDTCCQCYRGHNKVNGNVVRAVSETKGQVLTYDGKICTAVYSSSTGGCTVASAEAWGGTRSYLTAVITPWENYNEVPKGSWTVTYTSTELLRQLNSAGYTSLSGGISDVTIKELADGSTYVWSVVVTDIYGSSVTIRRTDKIRAAFGLSSANFVVGKAGETVQITDYTFAGTVAEAINAIQNPTPKLIQSKSLYILSDTNDTIEELDLSSPLSIITSDGIETVEDNSSLCVLSENGIYEYQFDVDGNIKEETDEADETLEADDASETAVLPDLSSPDTIVETIREVVCEGEDGEFVFIGRGWGHGVGLSQYGAKALADLGYDYKTILSLYLKGTEVTDYSTLISY